MPCDQITSLFRLKEKKKREKCKSSIYYEIYKKEEKGKHIQGHRDTSKIYIYIYTTLESGYGDD